MNYEPTGLPSTPVRSPVVRRRQVGIFIHWGVYSVPAWAPRGAYAEWYWDHLQFRDRPTGQFHDRIYGPGFRYQDFARSSRPSCSSPTSGPTCSSARARGTSS